MKGFLGSELDPLPNIDHGRPQLQGVLNFLCVNFFIVEKLKHTWSGEINIMSSCATITALDNDHLMTNFASSIASHSSSPFPQCVIFKQIPGIFY